MCSVLSCTTATSAFDDTPAPLSCNQILHTRHADAAEYDLDTGVGEDLVEQGGVLAVAVTNDVCDRAAGVLDVHDEVAGSLRHPCRTRVGGGAEAGCAEIYIDEGVSGKAVSRPELDKVLARLRRGDTLVIIRLSRLFRSLKHLISLTGDLRERGVDLKVTQQDIDTSTSTGRLMFHLLGAFAVHPRTHRRGHPRGPGRRPRPGRTHRPTPGADA